MEPIIFSWLWSKIARLNTNWKICTGNKLSKNYSISHKKVFILKIIPGLHPTVLLHIKRNLLVASWICLCFPFSVLSKIVVCNCINFLVENCSNIYRMTNKLRMTTSLGISTYFLVIIIHDSVILPLILVTKYLVGNYVPILYAIVNQPYTNKFYVWRLLKMPDFVFRNE